MNNYGQCDPRVLRLFDGKSIHDTAKTEHTGPRGEAWGFIPGTDRLVFHKTNKIIIPGAEFTARKHFQLTGEPVTPTYNSKLNLEHTVVHTANDPDSFTWLFAVGTDGCGTENSQVFDVDYKKWIMTDALVPFRYPLSTNDIGSALRANYFGRKTIGDRIAYYFKAFDTSPTIVMQYLDGTPIDATIYDSSKTDEAETYVELRLKTTMDDCREFFVATSSINDARINTISLLTAWPKTISETPEGGTATNYTYYQDIRPLTKLNIPNEALIDLTKGLDIVYHIYY